MLQLNFLHQAFATLDPKWQQILSANFADSLVNIDTKLVELSTRETIFPKQSEIFNAFRLTKFDDIAVVIVGQDPYHGDNEATGLAFAVNPGINYPPSLRNILRELANQYNVPPTMPAADLLPYWAEQGVLLLNSSLTVIKDRPNSLSSIGWQLVTDGIIRHISQAKTGVVFILWGNFAYQKARLIDTTRNKVLHAAHPSPLSVYRGFWGCNHFRLANQYLVECGKKPINWIRL
jgi:uracil-DNA glycosylase